MTLLEMYEKCCTENMYIAVLEDDEIVAAYDGRDSVPEEYNDREIMKVKSVAYPLDGELVIVAMYAYLKEV